MSRLSHTNRHSGLRVDAKKRRYLRRHTVNKSRPRQTLALSVEAVIETEDDFCYWDGPDCECWTPSLSSEDVLSLLREEIHCTLVAPGLFRGPVSRVQPIGSDNLVPALQTHLQTLTDKDQVRSLSFFHSDLFAGGWWDLRLFVQSQNQDTLRGLRKHPTTLTALTLALVFSPFWIRPLHTFSPGPNVPLINSLIGHLFVRYPIPNVFYQAFADFSTLHNRDPYKWIALSILLGQGASLPKVAGLFGWSCPKGLVPPLFECPASMPLEHACFFAEIVRCGGGAKDASHLLRHGSYAYDPTEPEEAMAQSPHHKGFVANTVRFLAAQKDELSVNDGRMILDWGLHMQTETEREASTKGASQTHSQTFSWKGRTLKSVLANAREYEREREQIAAARYSYQPLYWKSHGWDFEYTDEEGTLWTVEELTSTDQLLIEGQAMRHCVGGYSYACKSGYSAIFSMKQDSLRRITIEIQPDSMRIVQAKGLANRAATSLEQTILNKWLARARGAR